jgi:tRNA(adenine34) deaminase
MCVASVLKWRALARSANHRLPEGMLCSFSRRMLDDTHFMELALAEARASEEAGEVPIGAVLVQDSAVLASSGNRTIRNNDPTAHAEIMVIREAARVLGNYRLSGCTLYVILEPCAMCAGAIIQARIPRLVYGADDPKGGAFRSCFEILTSAKLNHRVDVVPGVLADQSASLLQTFFALRR